MQRTSSTRGDRVALGAVVVGALAVVLAALPYKAFDLDRFFIPKELVLHVVATVAALACIAGRRRLELAWVDVALAVFVVLGIASTALATNHWVAARALAITTSGAALYWASRSLRHAGHGRYVALAIAAAAAIGAATALAQAYGIDSPYFSINRAPGGTFGNRNFVAHVAAIAFPVTLLLALAARRGSGFVAALVCLVMLSATLILSRSRAAWLALAVAMALVGLAGLAVRSRWHDPRLGKRIGVIVLVLGATVAAAVFVPNRLNWRSDNPYLESVRGVVNYKEGSGKGRVVQYRNTLRMALAHPLLGVGPGNWAVAYPKYASRGDPSLDTEDMTANPWPSSDWAAFVSERGVVAAAALMFVFVGIGVGALRQLAAARTPEQIAAALALGGTLVATIGVGAFDAVLLLAAPTLLVWPLLGALGEPRTAHHPMVLERGVARWGSAVVFAIGGLAVAHSALEAGAMAMYSSGPERLTAVRQAVVLDRGSYRMRMRLAETYMARGSCESAVPQAQAAHDLFPNAPEPRRVLAACGVRVRSR